MARFRRATHEGEPIVYVVSLTYFLTTRDEKQPAVYVISNKRYGTLYTGVTSALWLRICDHKNGVFGGFSKKYGLGNLVWYEHHPTMPSAIHRETRLKKWQRTWKLNLINSFNPDWRDLHDEIDSTINFVEEFTSRKV
jgi:putative endonuclease